MGTSPQYRFPRSFEKTGHSPIIIFITGILPPFLLFSLFVTLFIPDSKDFSKFLVYVDMVCIIGFDFFMAVKHFISSSSKMKTLYFDISFHYLFADLVIFIAKAHSRIYFISKLPFFLYHFAKTIDSRFSSRQSNSDFLLNFTRPIMKSIGLQRFRAFMEILVLFYLIFYSFVAFRLNVIAATLGYLVLFIILAYRTDPCHRDAWRWIMSPAAQGGGRTAAHFRAASEKVELVARSIYPTPYVY
ncbi:hypothetical protein TRFO_38144 [Tritrichomonas foetus]|uniref:Uncharacterized protein n=1 Tax=Tritrichomonas foetus TaxID=1144522 RepID=A0A1J4JDK2_9EUKA|nr:hypothetical protein TRFO_38144 [Tritrichomonas foetus]|eukprot:OHS95755.1 hypothetical protein TRFO_38144 [Tritrichomonas foetus]